MLFRSSLGFLTIIMGLVAFVSVQDRDTTSPILAKEKAIQNGTFYEFAGPLYDQSGKLMVAKGKRLGIKDLYSMQWLVKGVIGSVSHVPPPG